MIAPAHIALAANNPSRFDVCVVGAGPVGITLALELAELGQRVLVLESGGKSARPQTRALSHAKLTNPNAHDDMLVAVARQLGGTSNLWGGRCVPYDPIDFAHRPGVLGAQWPISHDEIAPHYDAACRYASCGDDFFDGPVRGLSITDSRFSCSRLERWSNRPRFQQAYRTILTGHPDLDVRLGATVVDLDVTREGHVSAVVVAQSCGRRMRIAVNKLILAAGGVETARLLLHVQQRMPHALGGIDGPLGRYYMGHLIGQIADITFASDTLDAACDFFVDGHGSYVRRRFVACDEVQLAEGLTNVAMWPVVPVAADPRHGSGVLSLGAILMHLGPLARLVVAEAIRQRHVRNDMDLWGHVRNVLCDFPRAATFAARAVYKRYVSGVRHPAFFVRNREMRYGLAYHAEHLPNPDSRVRLTNERDALGLPRVEIDLRFTEADALGVVRTHEVFADWLRATGLGRLDYRQRADQNLAAVLAQGRHGTHQIGLVRMGSSPGEAVVDRDLKCFGFDNLYVAGTAVLPTSGQASPTLAAMALAVRLANHLAHGGSAAPAAVSAQGKRPVRTSRNRRVALAR